MLLLKIAVIWISIDVVAIASIWFAVTSIRPLCPDWWERYLVGEDPEA